MLDAFAHDHPAVLDDDEDVARLVAKLAELGVWTLGTAAEHGGGDADATMTAVVFERLGRSWPALGWASVQAHVAVDVLGASQPQVVSALHEGRAAVAVVHASADHVRLSFSGDRLVGTVGRVDAAAAHPHLLVLDGDRTAYLVSPEGLSPRRLARTGLGGAFTSMLEVDAGGDDVLRVDCDLPAALGRLWAGAAAVAAGVAGVAADGAAAYAAGRQQFGDALTAIPTVRQALLAQVVGSVTSLTTAVAVDATQLVQAYAAVSHACDGAIDVAAAALQAHGGYGYLTEYPAERYLRDAVSLRAAVDLPSAARLSASALVGWQPGGSALRAAP